MLDFVNLGLGALGVSFSCDFKRGTFGLGIEQFLVVSNEIGQRPGRVDALAVVLDSVGEFFRKCVNLAGILKAAHVLVVGNSPGLFCHLLACGELGD